eukprot:TRINITY_DN35690_c0_g1_i1.p1 TRINITY_DN35690_c0_g1~~TRINITY_DN35690_c0_g1_i1.p1  ORF type:complete len:948 (+),score=211.76 TRINITY_DN35690_c0_g1_i1:426-2846(+)
MVNSLASSQGSEDERASSPPRAERVLRSSSDPDLLSNKAPSNETAKGSHDERRRSRTPGAPVQSRISRQTSGDMPPTPSGGGRLGLDEGLLLHEATSSDAEARFQPPARSPIGEKKQAEEAGDAASSSQVCDEAESSQQLHNGQGSDPTRPEGVSSDGGQQESETLQAGQLQELVTEEPQGDQPEEKLEQKSLSEQPDGEALQDSKRLSEAPPLTSSSPSGPGLSEAEALKAAAMRHLTALDDSSNADQRGQVHSLIAACPNAFIDLGQPIASALADEMEDDGPEAAKAMMKKRRCDYFDGVNRLVSLIMTLSGVMVALQEKAERKAALGATLNVLNRWLLDRRLYMALSEEGPLFLLGLHLPLWRNLDSLHQILHIHVDLCRIFTSATRAPFLMAYESANLDEVMAAGSHQTLLHQNMSALPQAAANRLASCVLEELNRAMGADSSEGSEDCRSKLHRLIKEVTPEQWKSYSSKPPPAPAPEEPDSEDADANEESASASRRPYRAEARKRKLLALQTRDLIWGEPWAKKVERIRQGSPYRHYPSWNLNAVMVKGGDDLRQELLASQIIEQFSAIFQEAGLPLWLKATKVLVTSSTAGFLEFIHDSISVDAMKKLFPGKSLADIFKVAFADRLFDAKKNFIESSAAYSLVVYFLQVKDRHNGNLMMLTSGHVVHIDFGFMLSNSPGGNMAFENSPFKLTQEILDVMDGECSEQYEYFRTLLIRGFLEARKHMERIVLQVRMMLTGSKMPCFREGPDFVLQTLQDRFFANLTEEACIEKVVELIDTSVNNWRTIQYDNYQRIVNGIL